jgi:uncharacterized protein YjeT (DUF2065 family)
MTTTKKLYERLRPMIIWLGLTELAWISYWLLSVDQSPAQYVSVVLFWVIAMLIWIGVVSFLGLRGFYLRYTHYFSNLVGFVFVLIFTAIVFGLVPTVMEKFVLAANNTPDIQLVGIHTLRLLAVGTIIKYLHGELPLHFLILGSLTDLFFAISAVVVTLMTANGSLGQEFLVVWHLLGCAVFLGAGFSMFFTMPSALRLSHRKPDASIVFKFPMLLAPNFTVPLFVVAHGVALVKLLAS